MLSSPLRVELLIGGTPKNMTSFLGGLNKSRSNRVAKPALLRQKGFSRCLSLVYNSLGVHKQKSIEIMSNVTKMVFT